MELLPAKNEGYSTMSYWDERYSQEHAVRTTEDDEGYDWFKSYSQLKEVIVRLVKKEDRIIMLGCGNSTLSKEMYQDGYTQIVNIDYSAVLIERMREQHHAASGETMSWIVGDIKDLPCKAQEFDIAIDKGTMDALMSLPPSASSPPPSIWSPSPEILSSVAGEIDEALRVLKVGGKFVYITFAQPHFRVPLMKREGCDVEVTQIGDGFYYYCYVLTKGAGYRPSPNLASI